ncbi:replicative DNA helicase [Isoptericola sp. b515]|nr:replicative DNA helicase [Isoptericola sp. b515]MDO8147687.1 replicative DNA helicase [Isoptericola sp. b515]
MSIEELEAGYGSRPAFDRTPPQDLDAEMSVLGGMLLSKDAIADVVEQIRGNDFYRPAHEAIYEAIIDLYGRGEPADAITVVAELTKRGEIGRMGGASYIHDLMAGVPTAANAGYYARIVRERAVLRRLVEAGTKIVQLGYATDGGDVETVVNNAQAEIYAVTERRTTEDYAPLADIIGGTMDEIEAAGNRGEGMVGVPTGFADLDRLTNGLHPGQMIVVAARPAMGKALALDTPLPTPNGWTTMGEVAVGDELLAPDGTPTRVVEATEVLTDRPCYEVEFDDGTTIVADAQHEWATSLTGDPVDTSVRTTEAIVASMDRGAAHSVSRPGAAWKIVAVRPTVSVPVRCVQIDHADHLYLASRAMIPTHNSTLALDLARAASIKAQKTSVVFSLEMSRNEITMRLLSAEARVHLQKLRNGSMGDDDWQKLAKIMGKVSEAPLFIDDSPNMSLTEIRAKCRRLKQKHDLELVIVDYLQLMTSGKKVESRQQEVSEFSRALKLLAKEIEVPVIALSQLNRGPETRSDKKPQMSDLRESGCLTEDTKILRADTGAETTMGELHAEGATDVPVWALNDRLQYVRRHLTHVFSTGVKPVYRLRLASGKEIEATANHPFLTYEGWTPLGELEVGSRLGVPRHVPGPEQNTAWDDRKVVMLAHLLGGGESSAQVASLADGDWAAPELGVPAAVFHLPKDQIALFLKTLFTDRGAVLGSDDDGRVTLPGSRRVLEGVARLLLRFGIATRVTTAPSNPRLTVDGVDDLRRFLQEIGIDGSETAAAARLLEQVRAQSSGARGGTRHIWDEVRDVLSAQVVVAGTVTVQDGGRQRLGVVAEVLDEADLEIEAVNDLLWEEVVSIEPVGEKQVFDATVLGTHNFIANGIAVHNSIEQDADMVILLHREDAYEKESPRAGEADLIVAKHRNGPTDTITVAFQGHYSRFVDMQV